MSTSLLENPLINQTVFSPKLNTSEEVSPHHFPIPLRDGTILACYFFNQCVSKSNKHTKTLIIFHGKNECIEDLISGEEFSLHRDLIKLNLNILYIEYRGYGKSLGNPSLSTLLDDVEDIGACISISFKDVLVFGRHIGSICAIHFAFKFPQISGLIIESGIARPSLWILNEIKKTSTVIDFEEKCRNEFPSNYDMKSKLRAYKGKLLVIHYMNDTDLDTSNATKIVDWSHATDKRKILFSEGDQNTLFKSNFSGYFQVLYSFLLSCGYYPSSSTSSLCCSII